MTIWSTRQWEMLRRELALVILAVGLVANVVWIMFGSWATLVELGHMIVYVASRLR
ncbi:hypothetical protein [Methylobacterium pseudosasicola]|uniref:Uncharacterized protein n=1 Tax=Methylobacterium pseudosasicola TaxID=582667 RepID=A0A1I4SB80_9HYPH|nr:hypothetical protein [Methylobacterium pseudosasicola]SFM61786.1 hypothetical protein SAMN05192568_104132 [Methylobacterium pseudosasicola]